MNPKCHKLKLAEKAVKGSAGECATEGMRFGSRNSIDKNFGR